MIVHGVIGDPDANLARVWENAAHGGGCGSRSPESLVSM